MTKIKDMTDAETAAHIRKWMSEDHGAFEWPTDACGYKQHIRFVDFRNKHADKYQRFDTMLLDYCARLESGAMGET